MPARVRGKVRGGGAAGLSFLLDNLSSIFHNSPNEREVIMPNKRKEPNENDRCEIRFFVPAELHQQIKDYLKPYGGSFCDFARLACFRELERQKADHQQ